MTRTFAAAINGIDGRTHVPVIEHLRRAYAVDFVDMITEPGACNVLAENKDEAVVAHHDCAACSEGRQE